MVLPPCRRAYRSSSNRLFSHLSMRFLSTLLASVLGTLLAFGVVVFFGVFFLFALALSADQTPTVQTSSVLEVPIEGDIPERLVQDPFQRALQEGGPSYDLQDVHTGLRNAASDDRIEAIWLRMKGSTADWGTLQEVRQAIVQARDQGVPVIASSEDFGMSEKDYFLASAADSVYAGPLAPFEYNGFTTIVAFFQNALQKLEIEPQLIRAGRYKSAGEQFVRSDLSEPNRQQISSLLETTSSHFIQSISDARNLSPEALDRLAEENALVDANTAINEGLLDGLRHENEVRNTLSRLVDRPNDDLSTVSLGTYRHSPIAESGLSYTGEGTVAVVHAEGNIVSGDPGESPLSPTSGVLGSTTLINALEEARTDGSVEAVVLRVNSPGGSAAASEAMWNAVERTANEKPVIASLGDVAASGGYYLSAGADSLIANPTTVTGSIGVFGLLMNVEGLFEDKLGVTFDEVATSPYADMFTPITPLSSSERALIGQSVDRTYQTFLQRVAAGRNMDTSAVHEVAQGRVWSGQDAQRVGLVDTLGTLEDAIEMAGQEAGLGDGPYRTRTLPRPQTFVERLNEQFTAQATQIWRTMTTTQLERKLWERTRMLERVVGTNGTIQARMPFELTIE